MQFDFEKESIVSSRNGRLAGSWSRGSYPFIAWVHVTDNNVEDCSHFQGRDEARYEGNKERQATKSNVEVHGPWRKLSPQIAISKLDDFPLYHWHIHRCCDI